MSPLQLLKARLDLDPRFHWRGKRQLKRGEILKMPGTRDQDWYYVLRGCLRAYVENEQGDQSIRFGYENEIFGALDGIISGEPSPLGLQALRKTELLVIGNSVFRDFIEASPPSIAANLEWPGGPISNAEIWRDLLTALVYGQMERELDLLTGSPAERYRRVFNRSPHLFQIVPAKYIASYLRMTPETLSRLRKS